VAKITFSEQELFFVQKPNRWNFKDLDGCEFGRLKVIGFAGYEHELTYWFCKCECGKLIRVRGGSLKMGHTTSCGCYLKELNSCLSTTHGHARFGTNTSTYRSWRAMINRCTNEKLDNFNNYGGRGITVCNRWLKSFENFLADMGEKPSKKHSIDRIDVNSNYSPVNCRWATQKEQSNNRRSNILITYNGTTQTAAQWADELGVKRQLLYRRLWNGWDIERAFFQPLQHQTHNYRNLNTNP
jgi:hypothetical protein